MLVTLTWKEFREHRAIWLTMVVMTCGLGLGLAQIVAPGDPITALAVASLSILGLAGAYGVVCGAMMLAGEHENGTLVFLDIFLGRRHLLWLGKLLIGAVFAATEALAVAGVLCYFQQMPPAWAPALVGSGMSVVPMPAAARSDMGPALWLVLLPVVTVEAFAWGLFGSALTRRVLSAAAVAALVAAPVWLIAVFMPAPIFLAVRLLAAFVVLLISCSVFFAQARETSLVLTPRLDEPADPRRRFMELWDEYQRQDRAERDERGDAIDNGDDAVPVLEPIDFEPSLREEREPVAAPEPHARRRRKLSAAGSPAEALCWLTFQQARDLCLALAGLAIVVGLFIPIQGEVLWPIATLLLGVACGVAVFAPEQRDLSYQFLASQHLPLPSIWRFKTAFWLLVAVVCTLILIFSGMVVVFGRFMLTPRDQAAQVPVDFQLGTLREVLGPLVFFGVWLVYGFCSGQVLVWLCRKTILAVLLGLLAGGAALGLWLPSLVCRGMSGWPVWVPPLIMLAATQLLVRAWAGGRIKERKPMTALIGCAVLALAWVAVNLGYRAIEVPDVGEPIDPLSYRETLPVGEENRAGMKIQEAVTLFEQREGPDPQWLTRIAEASRLPAGVIESPRSDGGAALLRHLPICENMASKLRDIARTSKRGPAFDRLAEILALSRSLRNKAPAASYLVGARMEKSALEGLDKWIARGKPTTDELRRLLKELHHHAEETQPPFDCAQTECFRAGGLLKMPNLWAFAATTRDVPGRVPERWLAGGITVSLELPWEDERKLRLWQVVWKGLLRGVRQPHWEAQQEPADLAMASATTRSILSAWLPADGAPSRAEVARLLDASWLTDERLFCPVVPLRSAGTRSRCRVDAARLAVALSLYALTERKPADSLDNLVPKYLPALPIDPYSGQPFHYRISPGERIEGVGLVDPGQGVLWSTGPDRVDDGAHKSGDWLPDDDPEWTRGGLDLVTPVPRWP